MARLQIQDVKYTPDHEEEEVKVEVHFYHYSAVPERGPSYSCGGEPGEPASVELMAIYFYDTKGEVINANRISDMSDDELEAIEKELLATNGD